MAKQFSIVFIFMIVLGCGQQPCEWNPIFENTDFDYLKSNVEQSLQLIIEMDDAAHDCTSKAYQEKRLRMKEKLLELKDYYIPLTTIRQKIYDAERYCKLNQITTAESLLKDAKAIITSLDTLTKSEVFDKVIVDLDAMILTVIMSLDDRSKERTYQKLKVLGNHINLMLEKGELVLSGLAFEK